MQIQICRGNGGGEKGVSSDAGEAGVREGFLWERMLLDRRKEIGHSR